EFHLILVILFFFFFFFSSRRRHTRCYRDWSSDVCSSDLSIVRGNTQQAIVAMLREAGAAEVHVRISSPPVIWPCFYGIDFATREELIAGRASVPEITASIGADSLGYVSLEGLTGATTLPAG